jgi:Ca2+-binding RTX toxin-like protein
MIVVTGGAGYIGSLLVRELLALVAGAAYAATIFGTPGDDVLVGDQSGEPEQDTIIGLAGDDEIFGERQADTLDGRRGNDTLVGRPGHDVLRGKQGDDDLTGGPDTTKGPRRTDEYYCGAGVDTVHLEKGEDATHEIALTCENFVRNK